MSSEHNKRLARAYFTAYSKGTVDAVMEFIGANYVLHPGAGGKPQNANERKDDEMIFFSAFSNIQTVVEDQIAEGDKVANRITMICTHTGKYQGVPATGRRITIPYIDITLIKTGKIAEEWVEFDMTSILKQIKAHNHSKPP